MQALLKVGGRVGRGIEGGGREWGEEGERGKNGEEGEEGEEEPSRVRLKVVTHPQGLKAHSSINQESWVPVHGGKKVGLQLPI